MDYPNVYSNVHPNSTVNSLPVTVYTNTSYKAQRQDAPSPPVSLLVMTTVLYVIIFVVGIVGNIAVITVVARCRSMRTFINFLFVNLCVADLFVLLISGPTAVLDIYAKEVWYLGENMCKFVPFLENAVSHAVVATILTISLERFRVACHSYTQTGPVPRAILLTFILIWVVSISSAIPLLFITEYRKRMLLDGTPVSVCITPIFMTWHKIYMVLITSLFFVIPFLFIFMLYVRVCLALVSQFRNEERRLELYPSEVVRLKRQMIQIIVTVVLVFFVCHSPYRALAMWTMFEDHAVLRNIHPDTFLSIFYFTRILLYSNHAINPIVYNFVAKKFRRALLWVCCDRRRKRPGCKERYNAPPQPFPRGSHDYQARVLRRTSRLMSAMGVSNVDDLPEYTDRSHRNNFMVLYENLLL